NVDNDTLARLMANEEAMNALMSIEGFRSLNTEINDIIIASEKVKKAKAKGDKLTPKEKKEISQEEKEYKSKRKMIQEKLIKFATRIPVFMYLTDFREYSLQDVITQLEPGLFKRVTGLNVKDFELLCSLGVFNAGLMNDAVYKFKRYEDSSLNYTGIDRHIGEAVGGYDTVLSREEFDKLFGSQQLSLKDVNRAFEDISELPDIDTDYSDEDEDEEPAPEPKAKQKSSKGGKHETDSVIRKSRTTEPDKKPPSVLIEPKPKKPKADIPNVKPGSGVLHKAFGRGTVIAITDGKIIVSFGKAEKTFLFPQAFELEFLKM
ncbi:MAG TPA: restriction endonuclease, partial [Oscillospiraceae bacterium]|nr:restriction endonuclease [Oscillospiraceae bacterium]